MFGTGFTVSNSTRISPSGVFWTKRPHMPGISLPENPSPPFRGEREGPIVQRWEGEVGVAERSGIPHLTPTLSAPGGGEGVGSPLRKGAGLAQRLAERDRAGERDVEGSRAGPQRDHDPGDCRVVNKVGNPRTFAPQEQRIVGGELEAIERDRPAGRQED